MCGSWMDDDIALGHPITHKIIPGESPRLAGRSNRRRLVERGNGVRHVRRSGGVGVVAVTELPAHEVCERLHTTTSPPS
jgi:hypothetical protein